VADTGDTVAGRAAVFAAPALARPARLARLVGLVVAETHRRRGIASPLLEAVEQQAKEWECDRMEMTSSRIRTAAHDFYAARGYEEQSSHHARYLRQL